MWSPREMIEQRNPQILGEISSTWSQAKASPHSMQLGPRCVQKASILPGSQWQPALGSPGLDRLMRVLQNTGEYWVRSSRGRLWSKGSEYRGIKQHLGSSFLQRHLSDDDMLMCITHLSERTPFPRWISIKDWLIVLWKVSQDHGHIWGHTGLF